LSFEAERDNAEHTAHRVVAFDTSRDPLAIHLRCPSHFLSELKLDSGLGNFAHYSSIIQKLHVFETVASQEEGRVTVALAESRTVVGYAACWYPRNGDRWSKLGDLMYEMGALEVSRNFRQVGLAHAMIQETLSDVFFEWKIAYMNGFSWHWDLDGTRLGMTQYGKMMLRLLKKHGFQEYYTNEPNIALREENLFMARIGSRVSEQDRKRFRNLRFGIVHA
jgi:acetoin utilization protein AcuA